MKRQSPKTSRGRSGIAALAANRVELGAVESQAIRPQRSDFDDLCDAMIIDGLPSEFVDLVMRLSLKGQLDPYETYISLKALLGYGFSRADIVKGAGISGYEFDHCMQMADLLPELAQAYKDKKIKRTIIEKIAKLEKAHQKKLIPILQAKGKLKYEDVHEIKRGRTAQAANSLPAFMFETPGAAEAESAIPKMGALSTYGKGWKAQAIERFATALVEFKDTNKARAYIEALLMTVEGKEIGGKPRPHNKKSRANGRA